MGSVKTQRIVEALEHHGVKPTANRIVVYEALAASYRPMSLAELEQKIMTIDKSGIFRSLCTFRESHLLHVIEDGGEGVRYELCHSHDHHQHDDMHVHFHCERCGRTFCIDNTPIPIVELPEGYQMTSANYVVKGICPECVGK